VQLQDHVGGRGPPGRQRERQLRFDHQVRPVASVKKNLSCPHDRLSPPALSWRPSGGCNGRIGLGKGRPLPPPRSEPQEDVMRGFFHLLAACAVAGLVWSTPSVLSQDKDKGKPENIAPDKLPEKIMKAVKKHFPEGKITKATKELEKGEIVYDI